MDEAKLTGSEDLLIRLQALQTDAGPRKTMVELGAGVWADAKMSADDSEGSRCRADQSSESVQQVTIEIGLGVCLDMPVDEGVEFTRSKIASLHRSAGKIRSIPPS